MNLSFRDLNQYCVHKKIHFKLNPNDHEGLFFIGEHNTSRHTLYIKTRNYFQPSGEVTNENCWYLVHPEYVGPDSTKETLLSSPVISISTVIDVFAAYTVYLIRTYLNSLTVKGI